MIHKARNGASRGVNNHVLIEVHEVVALRVCVNHYQTKGVRTTNLVVLVGRPHPPLTLNLRDDLACVFDNDLVGLEGAVATDAISAIRSLDDLHADVVFSTGFGPVLQLVEAAVAALGTQSAVAVVALVEHVAVLAILVTACVFGAHASGQFQRLVCLPKTSGVANKDIWILCYF